MEDLRNRSQPRCKSLQPAKVKCMHCVKIFVEYLPKQNMFLGHQTNFNKFGGPKNSQGIFSDHNGSIVDINNRKELGK